MQISQLQERVAILEAHECPTIPESKLQSADPEKFVALNTFELPSEKRRRLEQKYKDIFNSKKKA